ncbi:hypothetical protein EJ02DRAFT_131431 [Clathrospora elynae]|uniref:Uncharacterized protein n=1 Tax=Clathrospora elynae TaxID=706981 RepID=A0A6A5S6J8_9PLEO|nr:hypothetical protein EJ02DRAFT_131431 [Clathrospora elynae]
MTLVYFIWGNSAVELSHNFGGSTRGHPNIIKEPGHLRAWLGTANPPPDLRVTRQPCGSATRKLRFPRIWLCFCYLSAMQGLREGVRHVNVRGQGERCMDGVCEAVEYPRRF